MAAPEGTIGPRPTRQDLAPTSAWASVYFDAEHVDKLVDRLTLALSEKTQLVRELESARVALSAQQQQLVEACDKAERARATLATFLNALGHDLRAPFVSLDASLQLLEIEGSATHAGTSAAPPDAVHQIAQEMRRTCGHGLALINDLFELIRSDAGAWRVEPASISLGEILANAIAVVAPQALGKGISIHADWQDGCTPEERVVTDPTRVAQAVVNLLGNAVKFTPHGEIRIGTRLLASGGDTRQWLQITVDDSGPGIEQAILPRLFEPFAQGEAGLRSRGGVGLGLAIVKRCALLLGGDATAANRAEGGARFTLHIPVERAATEPPERMARVGAEPASDFRQDCMQDPSEATPGRALVVDDADDAARLLTHHLSALGATVDRASSLREGAELLKRTRYDLVIADLELDDGCGARFLSEACAFAGAQKSGTCQSLRSGSGVILTSARPAAGVAAVWQGVFLEKPVTRAAVEAAVQTARAGKPPRLPPLT